MSEQSKTYPGIMDNRLVSVPSGLGHVLELAVDDNERVRRICVPAKPAYLQLFALFVVKELFWDEITTAVPRCLAIPSSPLFNLSWGPSV